MRLFLIILSFFALQKSLAQSYMTGFENMFINGWFQINDWDTTNLSSAQQIGFTKGWQWSSSSQYTPLPSALEGVYFIMADYNSVNYSGTISAWLFSPNKFFSNGDKFSFYSRTVSDGQAPDRMEVRLSKNGASVNVGSTFTSVGDYTTTLQVINNSLVAYGYPSTWTKYSITLSGLPASGVSGRIAFRYYVPNSGSMGTNGDGVCLDSVLYLKNIPTNINKINVNNHFKIFPNPSKGLVKIYFSTPTENRKIVIQDISGNILYEIKTSLIENELDIKELSNGFYLISIIEDDRIYTEQIIIE